MQVAPLEYGRPRRRLSRVWVALALVVLASWGAWKFAQPSWRHVSLAYHVRQARQSFRDCQQVQLAGDVALYADRGSTPRLTPAEIGRSGHGGWTPPPPDVPPRVAKPPATWLDLARHVRAAASLDRTIGTFTASAAAGVPEAMTQRDEAVLFVGNPQGPPADPNAPQTIFTLTATPHELRWTISAHQHLGSTKKPGELSFTHPKHRLLRIGIVRRRAGDRIEWLAAKLEAPGALVAPYRINGQPGQLTMTLGQFGVDVDATDGWVSTSPANPPNPVWYLGSPDVSFVRVTPAWEEVKLRADLQPHALAYEPATQDVVAIALVRSNRTHVEAWRIAGGDEPTLLAAAQLNHSSDYVKGLITVDAKRFAAVMFDQAQVFDMASGLRVATCALPPRARYDLPHVGLNEDGGLLAALSGTGKTLCWWNVNHEREIAGMTIAAGERVSAAHQASVQVIGQQTFVFTKPSGPPALTIVDNPSAMPRAGEGHRPFHSQTVSPGGRWIAASGHDPQQTLDVGLTIYDWQNGETILACGEIGEYIRAPIWSGDGRRVAAASSHHIFVYDLPSRSMLRVRKPRLRGGKECMAMSADGSRLSMTAKEGHSVYHLALPVTPAATTSSTRNPS